MNWRWVEEGDGYVGRLQPHGQPLGVGLPSGLQCLVPVYATGLVAWQERVTQPGSTLLNHSPPLLAHPTDSLKLPESLYCYITGLTQCSPSLHAGIIVMTCLCSGCKQA